MSRPARFAASVVIAAIVVIAALAAVSAPPAPAQVRIPPDFTFEQGKDSPGPVTFSHAKHKEKAEKCQACHTKVFKMKKGTTGPLSMARMKAGEQCGACHNGKTEMAGKVVFTTDDKANCETCHRKP
ncbi:MAG TPA: c(7)-type cytochrome triheme domain-containing protein [Methylomirabilota bacterium]|nr:c(7)-type cytochrome triheme domain-containing protein [Methylomirabilota bacterium]